MRQRGIPIGRSGVWQSADRYVREHTQAQIDSWTPFSDLCASLMQHDTERGGGLMGDTPLLRQVRAGLERDGLLALEFEKKV